MIEFVWVMIYGALARFRIVSPMKTVTANAKTVLLRYLLVANSLSFAWF